MGNQLYLRLINAEKISSVSVQSAGVLTFRAKLNITLNPKLKYTLLRLEITLNPKLKYTLLRLKIALNPKLKYTLLRLEITLAQN